jgi:hypothetical protein
MALSKRLMSNSVRGKSALEDATYSLRNILINFELYIVSRNSFLVMRKSTDKFQNDGCARALTPTDEKIPIKSLGSSTERRRYIKAYGGDQLQEFTVCKLLYLRIARGGTGGDDLRRIHRRYLLKHILSRAYTYTVIDQVRHSGYL